MLMKSFLIPTIILSFILVSSNFAAEHANFSYEEHTSPRYWSQLDEQYKLCGVGQMQSPINFAKTDNAIAPPDLRNIKNVRNGKMNNNGHTVQLLPNQLEIGFISIGPVRYNFQEVHFHTPSEHRIDGIHTDLEAHFVFKDPVAKKFSVIGVLYEVNPMEKSSFIDLIIARTPKVKNTNTDNVSVDIDSVFSLINKEAGPKWAYKYSGSLTTPPCSETVTWWVAAKQIPISPSQLVEFRKILGFNSRPTQPRNDRTIG